MKWTANISDPCVFSTDWVHEEDGDTEWKASVVRGERFYLEVRETGRIVYEAFFDTMTDAIRRGESILRAFTGAKTKDLYGVKYDGELIPCTIRDTNEEALDAFYEWWYGHRTVSAQPESINVVAIVLSVLEES
jgi:hypothetical protein